MQEFVSVNDRVNGTAHKMKFDSYMVDFKSVRSAFFNVHHRCNTKRMTMI